MPVYHLFIVATAVVLIGLLALALGATRLGMVVRAAAVHPHMVEALGFRLSRIHMLVFAIGIYLAAVAGVVMTPMVGALSEHGRRCPGTSLHRRRGRPGLGSLSGAFMVAGLLGVVQGFGSVFFSDYALFFPLSCSAASCCSGHWGSRARVALHERSRKASTGRSHASGKRDLRRHGENAGDDRASRRSRVGTLDRSSGAAQRSQPGRRAWSLRHQLQYHLQIFRLLSFGHAAFFGFAAYTEALLLQHWPTLPVPLLILVAVIASGALGLVLGQVCVRRSGAYFSMTTLAIAAFFYTIAFKWQAVTGGTDGFSGFMPGTLVLLPGWTLASPTIPQLYLLAVAFLVPSALAAWALLELTPFGNAVQLIRQNEERASFLGYDAHRIKLANYGVAAAIAGLAGALWAILIGFVSTDSIDLTLSTTVIIMAIIGGTSWFWGSAARQHDLYSGLRPAVRAHVALAALDGIAFILLVLALPGGTAALAGGFFARALGRRDD